MYPEKERFNRTKTTHYINYTKSRIFPLYIFTSDFQFADNDA